MSEVKIKIKIAKDGWLSILRGSKLKQQECPHGVVNTVWCGDWCPKFNEPYYDNSGVVLLELCGSFVWECEKGEFVDERE